MLEFIIFTVTATDLSGNKSHFKFKLTVQDSTQEVN